MANQSVDRTMTKRRTKKSRGQDADLSQSQVELDLMEVQFAPVRMVFGQEMLREIIINYAIRQDSGTLSGANLASVRRVSKTWNATVSRLFGKGMKPLLSLTLAKKNRTPLNKFVAVLSRRKDGSCPFLRLKILKPFFRRENGASLSAYLNRFGNSLVELELQIILKGDWHWLVETFNTSAVTLPLLRKLKLQLTYQRRSTNPAPDPVSFGNASKVPALLSSILGGNPCLQQLDLQFTDVWEIEVPVGLASISLPPSITQLELNCELKNKELEILAGKGLPNLDTFALLLMPGSWTAGLVSRLLGNFSKSLRQLQFLGVPFTDSLDTFTDNWVTFSKMDKLEQLESCSIDWKLASNIPAIEDTFPKLKQLALFPVTSELFGKWTSGTPASKVESLSIQLVAESEANRPTNLPSLPILREHMQALHRTFANVTSLTLKLPVARTGGLKYLFREMRQLKNLKLIATEYWAYFITGAWDSLLLGVPKDLFKLSNMEENMEFFSCIDFSNEKLSSVRMLTELETLSLEYGSNGNYVPGREILLSDFTFEYALFQMPKLKELILIGGFKVSDASSEDWVKEGRKITFQELINS